MMGTSLRNPTSVTGYAAYMEYALIIRIHLPEYNKYHTAVLTI